MEQMVECYFFATAVFDLSRRKWRRGARHMAETIADMEGFLAVDTNHIDKGFIWIFDTENNAKIARNRVIGFGIPCSDAVGKCNMPKETYDEIQEENEIEDRGKDNND